MFDKVKKPLTSVEVHSSHGIITVDLQGRPLWWNLQSDDVDALQGLLNITQFSFSEWRQYWGREELQPEIDILDLGYYYRTPAGERRYEDPVEHHREQIREGRREMLLMAGAGAGEP